MRKSTLQERVSVDVKADPYNIQNLRFAILNFLKYLTTRYSCNWFHAFAFSEINFFANFVELGILPLRYPSSLPFSLY